jgi:hypothetical protein
MNVSSRATGFVFRGWDGDSQRAMRQRSSCPMKRRNTSKVVVGAYWKDVFCIVAWVLGGMLE